MPTQGEEVRGAFAEAFEGHVGRLSGALGDGDDLDRALALVALLGALTLSRALKGSPLS